MAVQLKTLARTEKAGNPVLDTASLARESPARALLKPMHPEPADKRRLMELLDKKIYLLTEEIHECHLTTVMDMQMQMEAVEMHDGCAHHINVGFCRGGEEFRKIAKAAGRVAGVLSKIISELSMKEVIEVLNLIDNADRESTEMVGTMILSGYSSPRPVGTPSIEDVMKHVDELESWLCARKSEGNKAEKLWGLFRKEPEGQWTKGQWFEGMKLAWKDGEGTGGNVRVRDIDKVAFMAAYSDLIRTKMGEIIIAVLERACGEEYVRTGGQFKDILRSRQEFREENLDRLMA